MISLQSSDRKRNNILPAFMLGLVVAVMSMVALPAFPLSPDFYSASSKMASGKWVRIEVEEEGMQFISNTALRKMGFADPSKVNVFGYGGRILSEQLDGKYADDLPAVSSIQTPSGILFYGRTNRGWVLEPGKMEFARTANHYSSKSFYFLSDRDSERTQPEEARFPAGTPEKTITSFTERLLHEQDLSAPTPSGRTYLGEDFRSQPSRTFRFLLPGIIGDAMAKICFAAKVSSGSSSIIMSVDGERLPSTAADIIPGISSSEAYLNTITTFKKIPDPGENLSLNVSFSYSGVIFIGALDYIHLEYERKLKIDGDELLFRINPTSLSEVRIEGCDDKMEIWNVSGDSGAFRVPFSLEGTTAVFTAAPGYGEYVAFRPSGIGRTPQSPIALPNQDIHAMPAPDLLIVAPERFHEAARRIARLHSELDGISVEIISPTKIYNEFSSGSPDPTAIRRLLKMWHDREGGGDGNIMHCLLMGRPTYDHLGLSAASRNRAEQPIPIWQSEDVRSSSTSYSTDDYIGMLDDNPRPPDMGSATIHVAVGRMPVTTVAEAAAAADKLEGYLRNPVKGAWRNSILTIADDQDHGEHLFQAEDVVAAMRDNAFGSGYRYEKLYLDSYPLVNSGTGPSYPAATRRLLEKLDEGVALVNYIGHASAREWTHESLLTWTDISSLTNSRLPFLYASTCDFLKWDADEISGGEKMWLSPTSGVIGMLCPSRKVFISLNGNMSRNTMKEMFRTDGDGTTSTLGEIAVRGKNATRGDANKLRFAFMGDPALRLPRMDYRVSADSIAGKPLDNPDDVPVVMGGERVSLKGRISLPDGTPVPDAAGIVDLVLFDAEKTVRTLGNGAVGEECFYNDRKSRLFVGKAQVRAGEWTTEIIIPSEIENNFSPAMLSFYYLDDGGLEGNGSCENLYVFGHLERDEDDSEGPEFTAFHLDRPSFTDGDAVSPSPTLHASFTDPSGINISDSGIGHGLSLVLDGTTPLPNVAASYEADPDSPETGKIAYPLKGILPGDHSLSLTVWDNAGNSSTKDLSFKVEAGWNPSIIELSTDLSTASSYVTFILTTDGTDFLSESRIEVFDLAGRLVWSGFFDTVSTRSTLVWNLHDSGGARVPRGIYLYRAVATSGSGAESTKSGKLAVTAQ